MLTVVEILEEPKREYVGDGMDQIQVQKRRGTFASYYEYSAADYIKTGRKIRQKTVFAHKKTRFRPLNRFMYESFVSIQKQRGIPPFRVCVWRQKRGKTVNS